MRVLKLTLGKKNFLQFFPSVSIFNVECPEGFSWRPDGKVTRLDARSLLLAYVAMRIRTD
jgi:hypothetical protein